jgi:hypothetical protein
MNPGKFFMFANDKKNALSWSGSYRPGAEARPGAGARPGDGARSEAESSGNTWLPSMYGRVSKMGNSSSKY